MRGAIAAGHPLTAEAGAQVLAEGGNAVDACLAAAFVSWVAESPLTGPGGGGFLLVHRARDGRSRLLDFFVGVPGAGLGEGAIREMETIDVDFDSTTQAFGIGAASVAVPGVVAGLETAHRAYGRVPWATLFGPAIGLARDGVVVTPEQAYLHAILDVILRHTESGRAIYGPEGERLGAGDRLRMSDFASTLELLAEGGAAAFYDGVLADRIAGHMREELGPLTREDLRRYRVIWRRPIAADFLGDRFVSNPPPSSGGVLIAYGLLLLDQVGLGGGPGSAGAIERFVDVMREQMVARGGHFARDLYRGGLADRLCSDERIGAATERMGQGVGRAVREPSEPSRTTHISVVDADGNAASLTASTGSGSGVVVPGTGVHLNNMLGEHHLNLARRRRQPGGRLSSMMAPSIVLRRRPSPPRRGERGLGPAARGDPPDRRQHDRSWPAGGRGDQGSTSPPRRRTRSLRGRLGPGRARRARAPWRTTSCGGADATSTSEAPPRWRCGPTARSPLQETRGVAGTASSSVAEQVVVRRAQPGDAGALVALAEEVASEPEGWLISAGAWRTPGEERRFLRALRRYSDAAVFVAETPEGVVGRMSLGRDPHPASRHVADLGLMVAASHRRRGIGKALLDEAVAWARATGVRKLELHVFPHNEGAIALYERFGFRREGLRRGHYRRGPEYLDAILMAYEVN